mgnify:CR=1 FL=1
MSALHAGSTRLAALRAGQRLPASREEPCCCFERDAVGSGAGEYDASEHGAGQRDADVYAEHAALSSIWCRCLGRPVER